MYAYPAVFAREGKAFIVTVPDIPEVITNGYSEAEAHEYAEDAVRLVLTEYIRRRRPVPRPSAVKRGQRMIHLSAICQAKLALHQAMLAHGIQKAELAKRLNWHKTQVERLLDLSHSSRIDQIEAALAVLGKHINIAIANAA
jgi:antitoxin HicB